MVGAFPIDWDFHVLIDSTVPLGPKFKLWGVQDGFPAYEVYIKTSVSNSNVTTVYQWSPPLERDVTYLLDSYGDIEIPESDPKAGDIQ